MDKLLYSLSDLPRQFERFWGADWPIKIQVLIFLGILFAFGYITARLLRERTWWKWILLLFLFPSFVYPFLRSQDLIFIIPIVLGFFRGFFKDSHFEPFGMFYRLSDWFRDRKYRREENTYRQAEEVLRRSREYEEQVKAEAQRQKALHEEQERQWEAERKRRSKSKSRTSKPPPREEKPAPPPRPEPKTEKKPRELNPEILHDAYEILGVPQGTSLFDCKKAMKELLQKCHPDKVSHLSEPIKILAEKEAKKINISLATIKKR